jgi:hypothetical protein
LGSGRRARRQARAQEFGARHPRLSLVIICAILLGVIAVCGYQLSYGMYLGHGWGIAALAGMAAAAGLSTSVLISSRRHSPAAGRRFVMAWLVLGVASASAIKFPFPQGPYGSVQAYFNTVHAVLLGYEAVTCVAIVALLAYVFPRARGRSRGPVEPAGHAPGRAGLPARLRFLAANAAPWQAGRLMAANGTVTWLSLNGDAEVDLTPACQALRTLSAGAHVHQPRTTTLATVDGLVEVDVSPRALAELARISRRPPYGDMAHFAAQD